MKRIMIITIVALTLVAVAVAGCAKKEAAELRAVAATSADECTPVWSPDGSKIFFKSDDWISVCDPDGSQCEKLTEIEMSFVLSGDAKRVFSAKTIILENDVREIAWNDLRVKGEIEALQDEYGAFIEEEKVGITNDTANLVIITKSHDVATGEEKTYALDIYIDLRACPINPFERVAI